MPIINGKKMSCDSCIRGHRSTKCPHYGDRELFEVRKPGRPMQASNRRDGSCVCGGRTATVAIPKKGGCGCGESHSTLAGSCGGRRASPTGPQAPRRISKPGQGSHQMSKTQSWDVPQMLQDQSMVNLMMPGIPGVPNYGMGNALPPNAMMNAMSPMVNGPTTMPYDDSATMGHFYQPMPHQVPNGQSYQSLLVGHAMIPQPIMPTGFPLAHRPFPQNGSEHTPSSSIGSVESQSPMVTPNSDVEALSPVIPALQAKSCCSGKSNPVPSLPTFAPPAKSCCSGNGTPAPSLPTFAPPAKSCCSGNGTPTPSLPNFAPHTNAVFQNGASQGDYALPANYGTFDHPIQQNEWQQVYNAQGEAAINGYKCGCGPGCSCVGCAVHPFNQESINKFANILNVNDGFAAVNGDNATQQDNDAEEGSPAQEVLDPADFIFVSYNFKGDCSGLEDSCPCGDECACVGCTFHKIKGDNPKGLDLEKFPEFGYDDLLPHEAPSNWRDA